MDGKTKQPARTPRLRLGEALVMPSPSPSPLPLPANLKSSPTSATPYPASPISPSPGASASPRPSPPTPGSSATAATSSATAPASPTNPSSNSPRKEPSNHGRHPGALASRRLPLIPHLARCAHFHRRIHELAEQRGFAPFCRPPADGRQFRAQLLTQRNGAIRNPAAEYRDRFRDALDDIARSLLDRSPTEWSSPAVHTEYGMGFCQAILAGAFVRWVEKEHS